MWRDKLGRRETSAGGAVSEHMECVCLALGSVQCQEVTLLQVCSGTCCGLSLVSHGGRSENFAGSIDGLQFTKVLCNFPGTTLMGRIAK